MAGSWPFKLLEPDRLVLMIDDFVILSAVWLTGGLLTVRSEQWRVPVAYVAGAVAFVAARLASGNVQLLIAATALASGLTRATRDERSFPRIPGLSLVRW